VVHITRISLISTAFSTLAVLAIRWYPQKILRRSSQGNPSVGGVKHERFWTNQLLYLGNGTR